MRQLAWGIWFCCLAIGVVFDAQGDSHPFDVGERLSYRVFWGPVPVGTASLEIAAIDQVDGHACYRVVAEVNTTGLGRLIYRVDSRIESWVDADGLFSRRFEQQRREGRNFSHRVTEFDYEKMEAVTTNKENGKRKTTSLSARVQDVISSLYYVRAQSLAVDKEESFTVNTGSENRQVRARPDKRSELSLRPVGEVHALRIEPNPTLDIVASNRGRLWFWVSDDERRLPLLLNSPMTIGTAKLVLYKVETPTVVPHQTTAVLGARR